MSDAAEFGHIWFAWPSGDTRLGCLCPFNAVFCVITSPWRAMHRPPRHQSMQFRTVLTLLVLAATVAPIPAAAQYYPPRPPRDVDTGPGDQPPPQYPQQYP